MNKTYKTDVLYVFGGGRKLKLQSNDNFGKEFFYGYVHLKNIGYSVDIIETTKQNISVLNSTILKLLERLLSKLTKLTFYLGALVSIKNLKKILSSRNIVSSNHGIGMTLFLFIGIFKLFKKINFIVINSGLFAMRKVNPVVKIARIFFLVLFLKTINYLIFTNRSEYEYAVKNFKNYSTKFVCLPFCIDTEFWKPTSNVVNYENKDGILFIGNNGHRDFKLVTKIAENLVEIPFTFITNQIKDSEIKTNNVKNILGDWNASHLSDIEVKKYYEEAKLVILPINDTLVSSGQSAGLQAASVGTAVITTKTKGFWDYRNYVDNENIIFMDNNNLDEWLSKIKKIYSDDEKLKKIGSNSLKLINDKYRLEIFNNELENLIENGK